MRKANEIKLSFEQPKQQKTRSEQIANLEGLINQLFKEFRAICSAWRQAWPNQETHDLAKDHWVKAFRDGKVHEWARVEQGLSKFRLVGSAFIPAPAEFIKLCTPEAQDLGLLPEQEAYDLACRDAYHISYNPSAKTNSPPEVYHTVRKIGANKLLQAKEELGKAMFAKAYKNTVADVLSGKELILPPIAVIEAPKVEIDPELRSKRIAKLKKMLGATA